jgi:hypothetical protein
MNLHEFKGFSLTLLIDDMRAVFEDSDVKDLSPSDTAK